MVEIATAATFALMVCLVWLLARLVRRRPALAGGRLVSGVAGPVAPYGAPSLEADLVEGLAEQLPSTPFDREELDKDLRRAGYYRLTARQYFRALRNTLAILVILATGVLVVAIGPQRQPMLLRVAVGGLVLAMVAWSVPRVVLALEARRRVQRIVRGLPDALDMVGMSLQGGLLLQDALWQVSQELRAARPDLAAELLIVRRQAEMNSIETAFGQFATRIDAPSIVTLAALITQNQWLGTGLAESLREYVDNVRSQARQAADEHAGKAQLRLLLPVTLCLVPSILILLWGPAVLELWRFMQEIQGPISIGR